MEAKIYKRTFAESGETEYYLQFDDYRKRKIAPYLGFVLTCGAPKNDPVHGEFFTIKGWEERREGSYFGRPCRNAPKCIRRLANKGEYFYEEWVRNPNSEIGKMFVTNTWF